MIISKVYRSGHYPSPLPTKVYLDANFLLDCHIFGSTPKLRSAKALFTALMSNSGTIFYVSTLALDEVWWKTPPIAAGKKKLTKQEWVSQMHQFKVHLDTFMNFIKQHQGSGKLKVIGVPADVVDDAYKIMVNTPIMPRDAFHVATALHHGVIDIISNDTDLTRVTSNINVYQY